MELFKSTFLIRPENYAKAARAVRDARVSRSIFSMFKESAPDRSVITCALRYSGLFFAFTDRGCEVLDCEDDMSDDTVDFMERVFKAISRSVEPGSYIEFKDDDALVRYVFLFDTVERWTVPHILYAKKEEI